MTDALTQIRDLKRPAILCRAAKEGAQHYRKKRHLRRLFSEGPLPSETSVLDDLLALEKDLNRQRKQNFAGYSAVKHVDVLIAVIAEAQIRSASV